MQDKLDVIGMTENRFWKLVALANWPKQNCDDVKIKYLKLLGKEGGKNFRASVDSAYGMLSKVASNKVHGVGNDSYDDLLYHIIGKGRGMFYRCVNNVRHMQRMADDGNYEESFSYCIPYDCDYKDDGEYSIDYVVRISKKAVKEVEKYLAMDNKDVKWLKPISSKLIFISIILYSFLDKPTPERLPELIKKKNIVHNQCKSISKFFSNNFLELPRKFTHGGSNGICTTLIENVFNDAERLGKFLA